MEDNMNEHRPVIIKKYGTFERYLIKKRTNITNRKIPVQKRKGSVLDLGCGAEPYFLTHTKFKKKYGIDWTIKDNTRKDMTLLERSIEEPLPYFNATFDVVTMLATIEHINKISEVLKEAIRVLKPGGMLIMTTPTSMANKILKILAFTGLVSMEEVLEHKNAYGKKEIKKMLMKAGYEKIKINSFEINLNNIATAYKKGSTKN
jgi:ubiquinone/menaquinone biosynthesis C-methylase UbiE